FNAGPSGAMTSARMSASVIVRAFAILRIVLKAGTLSTQGKGILAWNGYGHLFLGADADERIGFSTGWRTSHRVPSFHMRSVTVCPVFGSSSNCNRSGWAL